MSTKIFPVTTTSGVDLLPEEVQKSARRTLGKMPTILVGKNESGETAAVGFRYRRQSHHCELTYWGGENTDLLADVAKACVAQMIIEGRKRAEVLVETALEGDYDPKLYKTSPRGGKLFCEALKKAGFYYEGRLDRYTKFLEDVEGYSWVTLEQGLPEWGDEVEVVLGRNETTEHYREKNIGLYKKDRDYYSYTSGGETGKTFAEILQEHYDWVENHPSIEIIDDWASKGR